MKDMSLLTKLLIIIGAITAISTAVMLFLCAFNKKCSCEEKPDTIEDAAARDFEECCNACYSDSDDL